MKKIIIIGLIAILTYNNLSSNDFDLVKQFKLTSINKDNRTTIDSKNNLIITGTFSTTVNFDQSNSEKTKLQSNGKDDIFLAKLDRNGNHIWSFSIGGNGYEEVKNISTDKEGNIYIAGTFQETIDFDPSDGVANITAESGWDVFILKFNSSGDFLWVKNLGPYKYLKANSMALDKNNNIFMTGYFSETIDFNPGNETYNITASISDDVYILKLNSNGQFVWAKSFNGTSIERGVSCVVDSEENICITGYFEATMYIDSKKEKILQSKGFTDVFIIKLDNDGNNLWAKSFEGLWSSESTAIAVDNENNIFTTGTFKKTVDFDPSENIDTLTSIEKNSDVFISKLDKNGNHRWAKLIGGSQDVLSHNIATNSRGDVVITGYYYGDCDFDPNEGVVNATIQSRNAMFQTSLDKDGFFISANVVYGDITPKSLDVLENSNVIISTTITDNVEYVQNGNMKVTQNKGDSDILVFRLDNILSTIETDERNGNIKVYPNPSNGVLNLNLDSYINTKIEIYSVSGKLIKRIENLNQENIILDLNEYKGVCILKITDLKGVQFFKILNQ